MKTTLIWPVLLGILVFVLGGCVGGSTSYTAEDIGLRKSDLLTENIQLASFAYVNTPAGESTNIARSFENAPPLIPHDVEGMMEITQDFNMCTSCHLPELAADFNATAIPQSHFTAILPKSGVNEVAYNNLGNQMNEERYNCNQCHVPQAADVTPLVANTFEAQFRDQTGSSASNLIELLNEGVQ